MQWLYMRIVYAFMAWLFFDNMQDAEWVVGRSR
jgi:hypothetical protein